MIAASEVEQFDGDHQCWVFLGVPFVAWTNLVSRAVPFVLATIGASEEVPYDERTTVCAVADVAPEVPLARLHPNLPLRRKCPRFALEEVRAFVRVSAGRVLYPRELRRTFCSEDPDAERDVRALSSREVSAQ